MMSTVWLRWVILACLLQVPVGSWADTTVRLAVAGNFMIPMRKLAIDFEKTSPWRLQVSSGSTAKLYAQIVRGAPYDVFLAANADEPSRLVSQQLAVAASRVTYARGRLVLWAREPLPGVDANPDHRFQQWLDDARQRRIAIANPRYAPYGQAARQVLKQTGRWSILAPRLVRAEGVNQTWAYARSGDVDYAFVALSQVFGIVPETQYLVVPDSLYEPLHQQAVVLARAANHVGALAFLRFLTGPAAQQRLRDEFGYQPSQALPP